MNAHHAVVAADTRSPQPPLELLIPFRGIVELHF
jgi:hypothetical protein